MTAWEAIDPFPISTPLVLIDHHLLDEWRNALVPFSVEVLGGDDEISGRIYGSEIQRHAECPGR